MIRMILILVVSCFAMVACEGTATAQGNPPGNAPLPPNFIPGYSPLVPSINTFPSWSPRSNVPVAQRYGRLSVYSSPLMGGSTPVIVDTSGQPIVMASEPVYSVRPRWRLFGRR